jgi:hypothetical protein
MYKSILEDSNPRGQSYDFSQFYSPLHDLRPLDLCGVHPALLERVINAERFPEHGTPYGRSALDSECQTMCQTPEGDRNNQLLKSSTRLGQLIAGGVLEGSYAIDILIGSAQYSGLGIDEIERTILRENAGFHLGAQTPRNEHGYLLHQYLAASFPDGAFKAKFYSGGLEAWDQLLDYSEFGLTSLTLINQFQQLGILYLSNYLFFLSEIVRAALKGAKGTVFCLEKLESQYLAQASPDEMKIVENRGALRLVLGNLSPRSLVEPGKIVDIDFLVDQDVDLPSEWFSINPSDDSSQEQRGGGDVE